MYRYPRMVCFPKTLQFQSDLKQEEDDVDDELDIIKIYPVLAFGVGYRF